MSLNPQTNSKPTNKLQTHKQTPNPQTNSKQTPNPQTNSKPTNNNIFVCLFPQPTIVSQASTAMQKIDCDDCVWKCGWRPVRQASVVGGDLWRPARLLLVVGVDPCLVKSRRGFSEGGISLVIKIPASFRSLWYPNWFLKVFVHNISPVPVTQARKMRLVLLTQSWLDWRDSWPPGKPPNSWTGLDTTCELVDESVHVWADCECTDSQHDGPTVFLDSPAMV